MTTRPSPRITRRLLPLAWLAAAGLLAPLVAPPVQAVVAAGPTQLRLSWSEDPKTSMTVVWQTTAPAADAAVEWGETERLGRSAGAVRRTYPQETGVIYEAVIRGLKPGRQYRYRAVSGGIRSEIATFRTAPGEVRDFTFTAFGDHGVGAIPRRNIEHLVAEQPAFHLLLGDYSYANGNQPVWDDWFLQNEPFTRQYPLMSALGNHENEKIGETRIGYVSALARLAMPNPETWYSFDYCGVRFICFNSDDFKNPEQLAWLDQELEKARSDRSIRWRVLFMHHPLYSTNVRRLDNKPLIQEIRHRIDAGKIDLVLTGHNHNYERYFPLRGDQVANPDRHRYRQGDGPIFLIAGGGGKSLYQFVPEQPKTLVHRESTEHYLRVQIPKTGPLTVEAIRTRDRSILDHFEIAPVR